MDGVLLAVCVTSWADGPVLTGEKCPICSAEGPRGGAAGDIDGATEAGPGALDGVGAADEAAGAEVGEGGALAAPDFETSLDAGTDTSTRSRSPSATTSCPPT